MSTNPYQHLLNQNQPGVMTQPQQQQQQQQQANAQAYVYNPQQYNVQQQQVPQYNLYNQYNSNTVVPLDIAPQQFQSPLNPTSGITNKNSFLMKIVIIYIFQYAAQLGLVILFTVNNSSQSVFISGNTVQPLFYGIFFMAIIIPSVAWNIKGLRQNPASAIVVATYTVVYASLLAGLIAVGDHQSKKPKEGDMSIGDNFILTIFAAFNALFNLTGLAQLIVLLIIILVKGDHFDLGQFKITGIVISIASGIPFIPANPFLFIPVAGVGILFTNWFSSGLMKVTDEKFGLKQDQAVFGSLAVFVIMVCPCV